MKQSEILIFIPTYNERENVEKICSQILALGIDADVLFLDDNSTDGTGAILKELTQRYPNVRAVFRAGKLGVGSAHLAGISLAYGQGYTKLITMDCDFTHSPGYIRDFISRSDEYDVIVGSRYLLRNSLSGWNPLRRFLTHAGHFMTSFLLGMKHDATGAFRLYRLDKIPRQAFDLVRSQGYSFFFESLYILQINSFRIFDLPIVLPARTYGHSKMSLGEAFGSLKRLFHLYATVVTRKKKYLLMFSSSIPQKQAEPLNIQGWDEYWEQKCNIGGSLYDVFGVFYRKFIIRRCLNHFIQKCFSPGTTLLHAGCGSGQVDTDINRQFRVAALDISSQALSLYRRFNQDNPWVIRGDIFRIPFGDDIFDGAYNLGVVEHFTEEEVKQILSELRRVIKQEGRILVFWPPEFGLSVRFLKIIHKILKAVTRREIKLHPDEITLAKSRAHIEAIAARANLKISGYYFGPKDCFTQVAVVFEKS
jgi:dolichol-phosphate mannosyltransferase